MIKRLVFAAVVSLTVGGVCFAEGMMVEKLTFSTKGVDCYDDAGTNAVMAGECYALIWKRTGATFPGLPYNPPNPKNPKALGEDVWLVAYFPVAERTGEGATAFSCCPEVTIPAGSFDPNDAANGTWSVYLLDTRYRDEQGTVRCGYDETVTNAPRRINAYTPVPDMIDFTLGTTMSVFASGKFVEGGYDDFSPVVAGERTQVATYQIAFDAQGGECAETSRERMWGDAYGALPDVSRTGCEFLGWFTDATNGEQVTAETVATADATVYAQWKCTVTFDANGGTATETNRLVKAGEKVGGLPATSRTGYTSAGWFTDPDQGDEVSADTVVMAPVTYHAHWKANSYSVRFVDRDGEATMEDQPMTYDQGGPLSSNQFARVGYTFAGWTDDENEFSEVKYQNGVVVSNLTTLAGGTVDLYAIWQANAYTVKFNANGGEGDMADQDFVYDQEQKLAANGFCRDGFAFDHWTNAVGRAFGDREVVSNLTVAADGEVELFAVWRAGNNVVTFDACGGTVSEPSREVKTQQPIGELPTAERAHFQFVGWFTAPEGGEEVSATTVVTGNMTCYAQWSRADWDGTVENDWLKLTCAQDVVALGLGEEVVTDAYHYFAVDSGSTATLKVSGLPKGVKFDAKTGKMSGATTKDGVSYVTITASNKSKFSQMKVMVMKVGGAEPNDRDEIGLNGMVLSNLVVGTEIPVGLVTIPSGASVSGLPKGLKVAKESAVDELGAACDSIAGVPTKGGKCTIKVTEKKSGKTALLNVIVADPGSRYITVKASDGGTATKSGVYAAGSTLKLSAKASSKNTVFVGWANEAGDWIRPAGADARATSLSMVVGESTPACFTARFEPASQDEAKGVAVVPAADAWTFDEKDGPFEFLFKVDSGSLPKVAIKPVPAGFAFNGAKDILVGEDGEQYYRLVVKDAKKTKPGVYNLAFNVGNASVKQTPVTNLTLVVKNKRSGLYDLEYEKPYQVSVGVGDVSQFPAFAVPGGANVSVSGLPSGLKYKNGVITGVATKAGEFTVTITTTTNKVKVVDTVFMSVDALPAQLVGTFNGVVTNDDVLATEKLVLTATDKGKITAKIGTLSLSQTGWDLCAYGKAYVTLLKSSGKGDKAVTNEIAVCVDTAGTWNAQQVSGDYAVFTATGKSWSGLSAQRNPFGKSGKTYECAEAHALATNLAAQTKRKLNLYVTYDVGSAVWVIGDEWTMKTKYPDLVLPDKAPLTVQVKDTGAVALAGKLDKTLAASGSSVLTVDGANVTADFVIGKGEKKVVASLAFEQDAEGAVVVSGTAWTQAVE